MCTIVCWLVVETSWKGTPGDNLSRQWTDRDFSSGKKNLREKYSQFQELLKGTLKKQQQQNCIFHYQWLGVKVDKNNQKKKKKKKNHVA